MFTVIPHRFSVPWGSEGFCGWSLCTSSHYPVSSPPLCRPAGKWKAFRNHRNVMYRWRWWGGPRREKAGKRVEKADLRALSTLLSVPEGSVGIRGVPWGPRLSVVPILPLSSPSVPCTALLTNGRRFETTETLGIGKGGRENDKRTSGEARKKKMDLRRLRLF